MPSLDELLEARPELTLDELVEAANELLGRYLPQNVSDARVKEEVNPRLVRHYTTEEMLDPPIPKGRERRYTVDHLLQLLALRRLLAEGISTSQIGRSLRESSRDELRGILEGTRLAPTPSHASSSVAALAAIEEIRSRSSGRPRTTASRFAHSPAQPEPQRSTSSVPRTPVATDWERFEIMDGVELSIRSDVVAPATVEEQERLLDDITRLLIQVGQRRTK